MAQIVINEISDNYTYNIGRNSFATVALPITAMWGPAYLDPESTGNDIDTQLEETEWKHFPATQAGLEAFVSTYRGPSSNYKLTKDFSYQMAMTLLTAGYDVLVCRLCPGTPAGCSFSFDNNSSFIIKAKYAGSFGNNLKVVLNKVVRGSISYWNLVTYVVDVSGIQTAVENLAFVFDVENSTDSLPHIDEVESNFLTFVSHDGISDTAELLENSSGIASFKLEGGSDTFGGVVEDIINKGNYYRELETKPDNWESDFKKYYTANPTDTKDSKSGFVFIQVIAPAYGGVLDGEPHKYYEKVNICDAVINEAISIATTRYTSRGATPGGISYGAGNEDADSCDYLIELNNIGTSDTVFANSLYHREWCYTAAFYVYQLLKDKLNYNPQRIISLGWDDQDFDFLGVSPTGDKISTISPLHKIIMETSYYSRCATGMIDIPKSCPRKAVYNDSPDNPGYAQMLSRIDVSAGGNDVNAILYSTHSALFAPWGQYKYVGTGKQNIAPPSFLALMIQRAQILNQSLQYEWALPTNRKHNLKLGKFDYKVPKKLLDVWQKLEGVGVNVLTEIPELGTNLWGNSTLYEVPPATYQALANLSTRYLVNAVEDVAYKCGISITFQYNNEQAYNKFYAGVTPTLDTMKNVGAIDDYYVKMAADINGLDQVNANTVIGKIYLVINGVINDIIIDLIALPPGTDLNQYKS